ncbi:MAG: dual specificity protein phosphatase family protein [Anaerolineae bacterium]|nr:dual specificity protein phosphatase family protein [Anaerolineae bacterium]
MYRTTEKKLTLRNLGRLIWFVLVIPLYRLLRQGPRRTLIWAFVRLRLALTGVPTLRYGTVLPALFVGGQIRRKGWQRLQEAGVTAVVNMRGEHDDRAAGLPIPEAGYLHLPTTDDTPVSVQDLQRGADWIAGQIAAGGKVYVHCAAGSGRAPSMGAAYLIKHHGMGADEALAKVKAARPFAMPVRSQVRRLHEFEAVVRDGHAPDAAVQPTGERAASE